MDESLVMLAKDVRNKTLALVDGVTELQARATAPGLTNSFLWHAGHVLTVVEHLVVVPITAKEPAYPMGWTQMFGSKSKPEHVQAWPKLQEVQSQLVDQYRRVMELLKQLNEQHLATVTNEQKAWTLRYNIIHAFHDEANHQGEMWLLKKMVGRQV
jgi:hypothetical protein